MARRKRGGRKRGGGKKTMISSPFMPMAKGRGKKRGKSRY